MTSPGKLLLLGGTRSGKTTFGERLALSSGLRPVYVATAQAWDEEMAERIARHRTMREPHGWVTIEEPLRLPEAISAKSDPGSFVLVDCLTMWLTNLMMADEDMATATQALENAFAEAAGPVALISNEVGLGGIAATPLGRQFADHAGRLHQVLAARADRVALVAAGLPLWLKPGAAG